MKLCKDCRWLEDLFVSRKISSYTMTLDVLCHNRQVAITEPVTGMVIYMKAHRARAAGAMCGPEGRLWEKRDEVL